MQSRFRGQANIDENLVPKLWKIKSIPSKIMENPTLDPPRGGMEHPGRKKNEKGRSRAHLGEVVFRTCSTLDTFFAGSGVIFCRFFGVLVRGLFFLWVWDDICAKSMPSRGSITLVWTAPECTNHILTILENHRPRDHTLAPLWHHSGDHLSIMFEANGLCWPSQGSMDP